MVCQLNKIKHFKCTSTEKNDEFLRPEILNCVKLGDKAEVGLPRFALVILKEPERPSVGKGQQDSN